MKVGDTFNTYKELISKVNEYEQKYFVKFYVRESRRLAGAFKKYPIKCAKASPELVYIELKYVCIHGGKIKSKVSRERKTRTFRRGCEAYIYIKLKKDASCLEVNSMNETHNHEISKELFNCLLKKRKREESENEESKSNEKDILEKKRKILEGYKMIVAKERIKTEQKEDLQESTATQDHNSLDDSASNQSSISFNDNIRLPSPTPLCSTSDDCQDKQPLKESKTSEKLEDNYKEDIFDAFATIVVYKLRNLPNIQRIHAEKLINEVLYQAELGNLSGDFTYR